MNESFDTFIKIKNVVVLHFLRQQIDHDIIWVKTAQLLLKQSYLNQLDQIHHEILMRIAFLKRKLRIQGVKVISQQQSPTEFSVVYVEKGYQHTHSFRMEPLLAETQLAFEKLTREFRSASPVTFETKNHIVPLPAPVLPVDR